MQSLIYHIEGLQFDETRKKCEREINRINGVKNVNIDKGKNIEINYQWPATDVEIQYSLKKMGLDFKSE